MRVVTELCWSHDLSDANFCLNRGMKGEALPPTHLHFTCTTADTHTLHTHTHTHTYLKGVCGASFERLPTEGLGCLHCKDRAWLHVGICNRAAHLIMGQWKKQGRGGERRGEERREEERRGEDRRGQERRGEEQRRRGG